MRDLRARGILALSALAACANPREQFDADWIGDIRHASGVERMEMLIDSGARSVQVSVPKWRLQKAPASLRMNSRDSVEITVAASDTVSLRGVMREGELEGEARRGSEQSRFSLRRLQPPEEVRPPVIGGTYRTRDNRLLGVAPFSELGPEHFIVDYSSGRIGPLYPIARNRWLVGKSLIAPMLPADTLEIFGRGIWADSLRLIEAGSSAVEAARVGRDQEAYIFTGEVALHGTLTLPAAKPPYPAVVLVHGSGPLSTAVSGPWGRYFAGLGFAVLSYDNRGVGMSTGDWRSADFPALARDVMAAVRFLRRRKDIRIDRIGLWAASQGSSIAPIVASEAPEQVAFLVVHGDRMPMDFDPAPYWARVSCPVLLFFAELDANGPPHDSWPPIERALRRGGNRRVTRVVLPRANHLFLEARTGTRDEYAGLSRFVPGYFDTMARWLHEVRQ